MYTTIRNKTLLVDYNKLNHLLIKIQTESSFWLKHISLILGRKATKSTGCIHVHLFNNKWQNGELTRRKSYRNGKRKILYTCIYIIRPSRHTQPEKIHLSPPKNHQIRQKFSKMRCVINALIPNGVSIFMRLNYENAKRKGFRLKNKHPSMYEI